MQNDGIVVEKINKPVSYLSELREKLVTVAERRISHAVAGTVNSVTAYEPHTLPKIGDGFMSDSAFGLTSILELREAGVFQEIASTEVGKKRKATILGVEVITERLSPTMFSLAVPKGVKLDDVRDSISRSIRNSEITRAFLDAADDLKFDNLVSTGKSVSLSLSTMTIF